MKCVGLTIPPQSELSPEIEAMIEEDKQFWDFRDDIRPDDEGELLHWKYSHPRTWELFDWLLWGKPGSFCEIQVLMAQLTEPDIDKVQKLGESHVTIIAEGKIVRKGSTREPGGREQLWSLGFSHSHRIVKGFYD